MIRIPSDNRNLLKRRVTTPKMSMLNCRLIEQGRADQKINA
jgi:hypothetical protein